MRILGLTGSIGMGKSETSRMFRREGIPVYDADAAVHQVMAPGGPAVPLVDKAFPGVVTEGVIDRQALGKKVFGNPTALRQLESIIHPLVGRKQLQFLRMHATRRTPLVVMDIPLLYETGGEKRVDAVAVVSAPAFLQRQRVMARPGMTAEKLDGILAQQMRDQDKRRRADYIIPSGLGRYNALRAVKTIIRDMLQRQPRVWLKRLSGAR